MKKSKIKRHYIRIILRPTKVLRLSFVYFYGRIALAFALRGVKLPGLNGIKKRMPPSALGAYERQALIYDIKGERYSFRAGPLWVRKLFEKMNNLISRNRFWLLILLKTTIAFFIIAIPIVIFIIIRGILPVPERVAYNSIATKLSNTSNIRTDWLYTEAPYLKQKDNFNNKNYFNYINPEDSRGVSIIPVIEPEAPPGLIHFGIGYYPVKLNLVRGFLVGEKSPLQILRNRNVPIEFEEGNRIRIQYYLFPTNDNSIHQCQIQLKDKSGKVITSIIQNTPPQNKPRSPNSFKTAWNERFVPNTTPDVGVVGEFIINLKSPPEQITAISSEIAQNKILENTLSQPTDQDYISQFKINAPNAKGIDITDNNCIFALGDFSFERNVVNPPKRRGIIFILVDTLKANTAYNNEIMPNLNEFAKNSGIKFLEHRAQGNMTVPSVIPLMTSRYSRELGSIAFTYAADSNIRKSFYDKKIHLMASSMQNLGYRVGGIGWLSLFSEAMQGGVDLGFHNVVISETPEYEARQITEQMGSWLETYGDSPFFLYVHYNTMHGPYKPPLDKIDISKFISKPFGLNQKRQLYNGVGRYWDGEFENIIKKLKELGIYEDVDIIVTSDHGAQMDVQPWYYFLGVNQNIDGGYADKGNSLFDEEVRVPLIMHLAKNNRLNGSTVSIPTAHVDLFPTLFNLAGGNNINPLWRGIDLYPALKEENDIDLPNLLSKRDTIYFDGHKYAGILYWGENFKNNPMKYMRQLAPDNVKLYLTHNPWSEKISWYQPEMFSSINFSKNSEKLLPNISSENLKSLRTAYFNSSPSNKIIRFTPKYDGTFSLNIQFNINSNGELPKVALIPDGLKLEEIKNTNSITFNFNGKVKSDEGIWINIGNGSLNKIELDKNITAITCSNGNKVDHNLIVSILEKNICTFFAPPDGIIEANYKSNDKPVVIQKTLSSEQVQQLEGTGAGAALQNALRDWGYAK